MKNNSVVLQVGVKVLLENKEGKFLLVKRSKEKYGKTSGSWDIVGGRVNPGSSLMDNLKREVKEEVGLEILSKPTLLAAQDIIPNEERHIVRLTYRALSEGEPVLDTTENVEYHWLSTEQLKDQEDLDSYFKEVLENNF